MAVRALRALAERNQDRQSYDMTFVFTSDQDESWKKVIHLNQDNWFDMQSLKVSSSCGNVASPRSCSVQFQVRIVVLIICCPNHYLIV